MESAYQETDLLILTISGAVIDDADDVDIGGSAFEFLGSDETTITLRPTQGSGGVPAGTYDISGIVLQEFDGAVTFASKGVTVQGFDIDESDATAIAYAGSEFDIDSDDELDATVDVEAERKEFTSGLTDNFSIEVDSGADLLAVDAGVVSLAVTGSNLDFLNDGDGDLDDASYELDGLTEDEADLEGNTLTVTSSDAYASSFGITFTADGEDDDDAQALEAQSFSAEVELTYSYMGTADTTDPTTLDVGEWSLSGATVNLPYMPYGGSISQIIYLSNDGTVEGDIELTAFDDEGNTYGPVMLSVTAAPGAVTSLAPAVSEALNDEGFDFDGKLDITLVVNSPSADVEVFGAYNVAGDRLSVPVQ